MATLNKVGTDQLLLYIHILLVDTIRKDEQYWHWKEHHTVSYRHIGVDEDQPPPPPFQARIAIANIARRPPSLVFIQLQHDTTTIRWSEVNQPFIRVSIEAVNLEKHGQWQLQDDGILLNKGKDSRTVTTVSSLNLQTQPF